MRITESVKKTILTDHQEGMNKTALSKKYCISTKTILKIIRESKSENDDSQSEEEEIKIKIKKTKNSVILLPEIDLKKIRYQKIEDREVIEDVEPVKSNAQMYEDIKKRFLKL